jgi:creatinine amidohydrolase
VGIIRIGELTTREVRTLLDAVEPTIVLQPVGSIEPHGPHLPLETDATISVAASERAGQQLQDAGFQVVMAPPIPYGVTECAAAFAGAVTVASSALTAYLHSVVDGYLRNGFDHVCLVNNHLEPAHDQAVRAALDGLPANKVSVACPLTRRWGRTLSDEFKSGECHAGRYETSIMMAADPEQVDNELRTGLPEVPISLSVKLREGVVDFQEMGLSEAYCGDPAEATATEGDELLERLATMVVTEVLEAMRGE